MDNQPFDDEISLEELWALFRRGLPFALSVTILALITTFALVRQAPKIYQASATILSSQPDSGLKSFNVSLVTAPPVDVSAYEAAARSTPVLTQALQDLGYQQPDRAAIDAIKHRLAVTAEQNSASSLIHIQVRDENPRQAASQSNAVATALLAWDKNRATGHLQTIVDSLKAQIKALDAEIATAQNSPESSSSTVNGLEQLRAQQTLELNAAQALKSSAIGRLEIVNPAQTPIKAVAPRPGLAGVIAAVLAFIGAYLIVFLRSALDARFGSVDEVARDLGLSVLGEFPKLRSNARLLPRDRVNFLRTNLSFASASAHPKVFLVTSTDSGDGKTTVSINLAEAYARNDYKTLLIDADLRKPDVAKLLDIRAEGSANLTALLQNPELGATFWTIDVDGATFQALPCTIESHHATELLSRSFRRVLDGISDFDVIVIDSAPVLPVADSLVIAPHVSGVVLAANLEDSDKRRVRSATGLLRRLGVQIFGLAATNVPDRLTKRRGSGYGYGYGYGHETSASAAAPSQATGIRALAGRWPFRPTSHAKPPAVSRPPNRPGPE